MGLTGQVLGGRGGQQLLPDRGSAGGLVVHDLLPPSLEEVLLLHRHAAGGAHRRHAQVRLGLSASALPLRTREGAVRKSG